MDTFHLYQDIQARTKGEIYIGVVGPVRTGKSTFVRRFMEQLVLPHMKKENSQVSKDELPVSGGGKTDHDRRTEIRSGESSRSRTG